MNATHQPRSPHDLARYYYATDAAHLTGRRSCGGDPLWVGSTERLQRNGRLGHRRPPKAVSHSYRAPGLGRTLVCLPSFQEGSDIPLPTCHCHLLAGGPPTLVNRRTCQGPCGGFRTGNTPCSSRSRSPSQTDYSPCDVEWSRQLLSVHLTPPPSPPLPPPAIL